MVLWDYHKTIKSMLRFSFMTGPKLFMLLLGCRPPGRNTEQHDVFFGIGENVKQLVPQIRSFWPGAGNIHVDAWREVTTVGEYRLSIVPKVERDTTQEHNTLFFLNLGGYKQSEFDEFHYKMLVVAKDKNEAIRQAKKTTFYKHTGFTGAPSHIDDKFGVDVDEVHQVKDILSDNLKALYSIKIEAVISSAEDELHLGYFPFNKL